MAVGIKLPSSIVIFIGAATNLNVPRKAQSLAFLSSNDEGSKRKAATRRP